MPDQKPIESDAYAAALARGLQQDEDQVAEQSKRFRSIVAMIAERIGGAPISYGESGVFVHPDLAAELSKEENADLLWLVHSLKFAAKKK